MGQDKNARPLILAPAGGAEQLKAALRMGADAVYLGAKSFNARRNAENFGELDLNNAAAMCHERGAKLFVTLNTLVMDEEFPALRDELDNIAAAKADAVIVQDMGVAALVRKRYPRLPLYASTQTSVHNPQGAALLHKLGFSQVVLARELSAGEIAAIHAASPIQIECFVHGAHCMCMSGSCYLSAMLGGRSGNRGLCAQPCRLNFKLGKKEYALSLKDMSIINHMDELMGSGIHALKIEGRMKRPEYVAAAVMACKQAQNGQKPDMETLKAVFSRSGFTDGYYTARRTADMFGTRRKDDVISAAQVLPKLAALYAAEKQTIPLDAELDIPLDAPATLRVKDSGFTAYAQGPCAQAAKTLPLSAEQACKAVNQTGGTPYYFESINANVAPNVILPISALKAMRRSALAQIAARRIKRADHICTGADIVAPAPYAAPAKPAIRLRFENAAQLFPCPQAEAVILSVDEIIAAPQLISQFGPKLYAELPALCFGADVDALAKKLAALKQRGLTHVLADDLGLVQLGLDMGFKVHGDSSLNIMNTPALNTFADIGLEDATLSFELKMNRIRALGGQMRRGIIGYGYLALMRMRACPARGKDGCGGCTGKNVLVDEKRERFTLLCRGKKYAELLNSVPLYIGDKPYGGVDFVTLRFVGESRAEAERIYNMFLAGQTPDFRRTAGLYYRELL